LIDHAGISEQGPIRKRNEDFIGHGPSDDVPAGHHKGRLFIVCDGVGGSGAVDVASKEVTASVLSTYYTTKRRPDKALNDAIGQANLQVYDLSIKAGRVRMETTIAALAIVGHKAYIINVGDTRIYRIRNGTIEQVSTDHSEVAEMVKMRILTLENARNHPRRHVITRSMGSFPMVSPATRTENVEPGDTFVMCTDGLWEPVNDAEIAEAATTKEPKDACCSLIELAISRGSNDNVSVQIITVNQIDAETALHLPVDTSLWTKLTGIFGSVSKK
jgi:protein phosphatase